MNAIRQTALLNKRELENAIPSSASWHADYRDTAWIYIGGLPNDLTEGDVGIIFSQYGNPTHLNLIRDKETGKSKGFGFLKYEDQRSCDLAVDNLGGAEVLGRMLRVDHSRYKKKDGEDEETYRIEAQEREQLGGGGLSDTEGEDNGEVGKGRKRKKRKLLKEERELQEMLAVTADGEEEDPMREYLIREKKEEVQRAKEKDKDRRKRKHKSRTGDEDADERVEHKHRHRHGDDRDDADEHPQLTDRARGSERRPRSVDRDRGKRSESHGALDDNKARRRSREDRRRDESSSRSRSPRRRTSRHEG